MRQPLPIKPGRYTFVDPYSLYSGAVVDVTTITGGSFFGTVVKGDKRGCSIDGQKMSGEKRFLRPSP